MNKWAHPLTYWYPWLETLSRVFGINRSNHHGKGTRRILDGLETYVSDTSQRFRLWSRKSRRRLTFRLSCCLDKNIYNVKQSINIFEVHQIFYKVQLLSRQFRKKVFLLIWMLHLICISKYFTRMLQNTSFQKTWTSWKDSTEIMYHLSSHMIATI